jgi:hypothetical protein
MRRPRSSKNGMAAFFKSCLTSFIFGTPFGNTKSSDLLSADLHCCNALTNSWCNGNACSLRFLFTSA